MGQQGEKTQAVKLVTCLKSGRDIRTKQSSYCWCFSKHGRKMHKVLLMKLVWYLHTHATNQKILTHISEDEELFQIL